MLDKGLPTALLEREASRMNARLHFDVGNLSRAKELFVSFAKRIDATPADVLEASDWIERIEQQMRLDANDE